MEASMQGSIVVQCRFCGTKEETAIEVVADHFIENGCRDCQRRFNATAERLLQQVDNFEQLTKPQKNAA